MRSNMKVNSVRTEGSNTHYLKYP